MEERQEGVRVTQQRFMGDEERRWLKIDSKEGFARRNKASAANVDEADVEVKLKQQRQDDSLI